jgi:hypothetical protein
LEDFNVRIAERSTEGSQESEDRNWIGHRIFVSFVSSCVSHPFNPRLARHSLGEGG